MGQSASQAAAFYKDVARHGRLFTVYDDGGYPAPLKSDGRRSQPFWSSESRIRRLAKACPAYAPFQIEELSWAAFKEELVPSLEKANLLVGLNWSGKGATGYDLEPRDVIANVEHYMTAAQG